MHALFLHFLAEKEPGVRLLLMAMLFSTQNALKLQRGEALNEEG